jgi:heme exporter protein A
MTLFTGDALICLRGERIVFVDLDFHLAAGDVLVLSGANGSGKSSLLRLMAGLLRPVAGNIEWNGTPITADREAHANRLHYLGHLDGVKADLSVMENLRFWAAMRGVTDDRVLDRALERFGLDAIADRPARLLSQGQRRRLALSRPLAAPLPLWLFDEPSVGLDVQSVEALINAIEDHREHGGLTVIATHQQLPLGEAKSLDLDDHAPDKAELAAIAAEAVW